VEPFKNLLNAARVREAATALEAASPAFDRRRFERTALHGLDDLEMKARAMHIATALEATLPARFDVACEVIEAALAPPLPVEGEAPAAAGTGIAGWIVWPLGEYVARRGLDQPERALRALHALTQRLTAEFAIRPFIVRHPDVTLSTLLAWTRDPSAHVRRLASEGSRPRLPWGLRLQALVDDPSPTLPILAALQDDPSPYVRRSVANHLNDIAKDHPGVVVRWVGEHLPGASIERRALLSHASRTLVKQGHVEMLGLWGAGEPFAGECRLVVAPRRVRIGDAVRIEATLRSTTDAKQSLVIDYAVHYLRANGTHGRKVFKGWKLAIAPNATHTLVKGHSFRPVTVRSYYPGKHRVELMVNGATMATAELQLVA